MHGLDLLDKHMITGRINQVSTIFERHRGENSRPKQTFTSIQGTYSYSLLLPVKSLRASQRLGLLVFVVCLKFGRNLKQQVMCYISRLSDSPSPSRLVIKSFLTSLVKGEVLKTRAFNASSMPLNHHHKHSKKR